MVMSCHDRPRQDLRPEEGSAEALLSFCHWPGGDSPGEGTVLEAQTGDPSSPRVRCTLVALTHEVAKVLEFQL